VAADGQATEAGLKVPAGSERVTHVAPASVVVSTTPDWFGLAPTA
jgi:hypothetical protein